MLRPSASDGNPMAGCATSRWEHHRPPSGDGVFPSPSSRRTRCGCLFVFFPFLPFSNGRMNIYIYIFFFSFFLSYKYHSHLHIFYTSSLLYYILYTISHSSNFHSFYKKMDKGKQKQGFKTPRRVSKSRGTSSQPSPPENMFGFSTPPPTYQGIQQMPLYSPTPLPGVIQHGGFQQYNLGFQ